MSFLTKFNAVSAIEYKRCSELTINKQYPIVDLKNVDTRYGKSVLVTLEDDGERYRVYLPKRYADVFADEELRHINPGELLLVFHGMKNKTTQVEIIPR